MAISLASIRYLIFLKSSFGLGGTLLVLGKQDILIDRAEIISEFRNSNGAVFDMKWIELNIDLKVDDDVWLFRALGFSKILSSDGSLFEGADLLINLNEPIPLNLTNEFDAVLDCGTIEHVFDVRCSIENIISALKPGGRVIHISPSSNHVDHGFYMFSPTFFNDVYSANGFNVENHYLVEYGLNHQRGSWHAWEYNQKKLHRVSVGGLGSKPYLNAFCAKKNYNTKFIIPTQKHYEQEWSHQGGPKTHSFFQKIIPKWLIGPIKGFRNLLLRPKFNIKI